MRFCITTPQAILENDEVDIFETLIPAGTYHTFICDKLWQMYRYRGLGSCRDEFEQRLVDRYNLRIDAYTPIFAKYETDKSTMADLASSGMHSVTKTRNEDLPDTPESEEDEYVSNRGKSETDVTYDTGGKAKRFNDMADEMRLADPYVRFAYEFESLFTEFL